MLKVLINGIEYVPSPSQPKPSTMTDAERQMLANVIDRKGFDYAMNDFSDYRRSSAHVDDERFHQLRDAYCNARDEFINYLEQQRAWPCTGSEE
jgi:hypothetical protein